MGKLMPRIISLGTVYLRNGINCQAMYLIVEHYMYLDIGLINTLMYLFKCIIIIIYFTYLCYTDLLELYGIHHYLASDFDPM